MGWSMDLVYLPSHGPIAKKEKENNESHKIDELYEFSIDSSRD